MREIDSGANPACPFNCEKKCQLRAALKLLSFLSPRGQVDRAVHFRPNPPRSGFLACANVFIDEIEIARSEYGYTPEADNILKEIAKEQK